MFSVALPSAQLLAAEEGGHNPLLPAIGEIVIGTISFGILCFVLMRYVFPKIEQTYAARRDAIEGGIERAEAAQAEAQRTLELYREQLADARTEAARIRDNARAEGQRIIEELRERAQEESQRITQRGEDQLRSQREQLLREMRSEIGRISVDLAGRIVGESLASEARKAGTVDRFLAELDETTESSDGQPPAPRAGSSAPQGLT